MENDGTDYHIDTKLEKLFHSDAPKFDMENDNGDDIMADSLPEWLIGVIVVIIILIIAFFIMVISTIIKNKRKNQYTNTSDMNSSTHICDDLELGKISMVDPRAKATSFESEEKDPEINKDLPSTNEHSLSEPCCSSNSDHSPVSAYKNPLFVDDDQETDQDGRINHDYNRNAGHPNTEICNKSKGKSNKTKCLKNKLCNDLNSVQEMQEEEKEPSNDSHKRRRDGMELASDYPGGDEGSADDNLQVPKSECDSDQVLVHRQDEINNCSVQSTPTAAMADNNLDRIALRSKNINNDNSDMEEVDLGNSANINGEDSSENDHEQNQICQAGGSQTHDQVSANGNVGMKMADKESKEQNKSQRFSFIRMTLSEDEIENNERTYTKL